MTNHPKQKNPSRFPRLGGASCSPPRLRSRAPLPLRFLLIPLIVLATSCIKRQPAGPAGSTVAVGGGGPGGSEEPAAPPAPPSAPVPAVQKTGNVSTDRFLELWTDIHKLSNGYFSPEGIPYHAPETLLVEAPDHGHETTSEAYSYWIWLEAMYGKVTKDFSFLERAWSNLEYYMIPRHGDQPTNSAYNSAKPATYAEEGDLPSEYPKPLETGVQVGTDPIAGELKAAYGPDVYGMHWLMDVDNVYGFGRRADGQSHASFINTFQRGPQESVWETVPQPCWDAFTAGGANGFLDIFQKASGFAKQWKYTAAPDADARAIQAVYWAKRWADEQGGSASVGALARKASKLGDFARYALFDKYFKVLGCRSPSCPTASDYKSAHYLISWYYAWGGSAPGGGGWAWRIGSSHNHSGYQNPLAAFALASDPAFKSPTPNGARDWSTSLKRQIEFYRWLQSSEGAIAGGATNSWNGRYSEPPAGAKTFYGMAYDPAPVYHDPPSNSWFGFQVWTMERVAEYYYASGDEHAKVILDRWVEWAKANTKINADGSYEVPGDLDWSGQPAFDWSDARQNFDAKDKGFNSGLHVKIVNRGPDVGTAAGLAHTLTFYAKKSGDAASAKLAKELLDRIWTKYRDDKGISNPEERKDYKRFAEQVVLPPGWTGKMPSGDVIGQGSTFASIRAKLRSDPEFKRVKAYLDGGPAPTFKYHRFWVQSHLALAYATYGWLYPEGK
jgi:hypothetical protein